MSTAEYHRRMAAEATARAEAAGEIGDRYVWVAESAVAAMHRADAKMAERVAAAEAQAMAEIAAGRQGVRI